MSGIKSHFKATITRDPELKYTNNSGVAYCRLGLACNWREQGEQRTQYVDATAWGRTAEFANAYVRKGARVAVDLDRMHNREYTRQQDGQTVTSLSATVVELDLIDWPDEDDQRPADTGGFNDTNFDDNGNSPPSNGVNHAVDADGADAPPNNPEDPFDDDLPF